MLRYEQENLIVEESSLFSTLYSLAFTFDGAIVDGAILLRMSSLSCHDMLY